MEELYPKTGAQIKSQMYFWFLANHCKTLDQIDGTEKCTLFEKTSAVLQSQFDEKTKLKSLELPVFVLKVSADEFIINTTHRFIRILPNEIDSIDYTNFAGYKGFKLISAKSKIGEVGSIKTDGMIADFGLENKEGDIIYWRIPTGKPGFSFWNITKKCEIVGRKYINAQPNNGE